LKVTAGKLDEDSRKVPQPSYAVRKSATLAVSLTGIIAFK
jgi:hypothetical protein